MTEKTNNIFNLNRVQLMQLIKLTVAQTYPEELAIKERFNDSTKRVIDITKSYSGDLPNIDTCETVEEYNSLIEKVKVECINNVEKIEKELADYREESISRIEKTISEESEELEWDFNQKVILHSEEEVHKEFNCSFSVSPFLDSYSGYQITKIFGKIENNYDYQDYNDKEIPYNNNYTKESKPYLYTGIGTDGYPHKNFRCTLKELDNHANFLRTLYKELEEIDLLKNDFGLKNHCYVDNYLVGHEFPLQNVKGLNYVRSSRFVEIIIKLNGKKRFIKDVWEYLKKYREIYINGGGYWYLYNKHKQRPSRIDCMNLGIDYLNFFTFKSTMEKAKKEIEQLPYPNLNKYYEEEIVKWNEDHEDYYDYKLRKDDILLDKSNLREMLSYPNRIFNKASYPSGHSFVHYDVDERDIPYMASRHNVNKCDLQRNDRMKAMPIKDSAKNKLVYDLEKPLTPFLTLIYCHHRLYEKKAEELLQKYGYGTIFVSSGKLSFNSNNDDVKILDILGDNFNTTMLNYLNQNRINKELDEKNANLITLFPSSYQEIKIGTMNRSNNLIMIYRILEDGRADSWKEAANLLLDDKFRKNIIASLGEIKNGIHSVVYQIAEEGRRLNQTITNEFTDTKNILLKIEKNNENIKNSIDKNSKETNQNVSGIKNTIENLNNKTDNLIKNTSDIKSIFNYLQS